MKFYLTLLDLESNVQKAIAREEVSIKVAKALVEMDKGSRKVVFNWIKVFNLNINQQLKYIEYAKDISIKENKTISEVLSAGLLLEVAESPQLNMPQKAKAALETLRVRRFPRLAQAQQAVERAVSSIPSPLELPFITIPIWKIPITALKSTSLTERTSRERSVGFMRFMNLKQSLNCGEMNEFQNQKGDPGKGGPAVSFCEEGLGTATKLQSGQA